MGWATVTFAGGPAQAFPPQDLPCPTSRLAPYGLAPKPVNKFHCATADCLVTFKDYRWWTAYQYPFFNGDLETAFAPEHAFVVSDGLHLKIAKDVDLGAGEVWSGGEAVLTFNGDGSEANLVYGDYLVTAKLLTAPSWADLDPNVALGLFTYERPASGPQDNPGREIDLAEISSWGWDHTGACPFSGFNGKFDKTTLCEGNAQFATQDFTKSPLSVKRYEIGKNPVVTLLMLWHGQADLVIFNEYNGAFTFETLPSSPDNNWLLPTGLVNFIPKAACERFHINFWLDNYLNHPPPSSPQEAVITNFQFKQFKPSQ